MPWWAWIILGAVLLGAEVVIAADFYLVFFGVSGLLLGLVLLFGIVLPVWVQWLSYAVFAVLLLLFYRHRLKAILQKPDRELDEEIIGEIGSVMGLIAPGGDGQIELRGTVWSARNLAETELPEGTRARVVQKDGLFLHIRPES